MELGTKIKYRRSSLGVTQASLAKSIGVSVRTVQRYEEGTSKPNSIKLAELEKVLKIDLRERVEDDYDWYIQ